MISCHHRFGDVYEGILKRFFMATTVTEKKKITYEDFIKTSELLYPSKLKVELKSIF